MQVALGKLSNRVSGTDFRKVALWLLFSLLVMVLALFFGLLAVTASPILVGMAAGLVVGVFLLMKPDLLIWLILALGLVMGAFVSMAGPLFSKITWAVSILGFVLLILSLFNLLLAGKSKGQPAFIWFGLAFLVLTISATMAQWHSTGEVIAGIKRFFQAYGLMFAFATLALSSREMGRFRKLLLAIALLQLPFALYELLVLAPKRGGVALSSEATDVVAGTFGANLQGGSPNSVMVIYLLIVASFLVARWRSGLIRSGMFYLLVLPCLLPLGMGETKVAVVMLPLVGFVLIRKDLARSLLRYLPTLLAVVLLTMMLMYVYVAVIIHSSLDEVLQRTLSYNIGSQGYSQGQLLNRLTSITFWFQQQGFHDPFGFLIGNGLGSSYTSLGELGGHLGMKYQDYGIDLTAASTLLWDTGVIGFALFMGMLASAWVAAGRLHSSVSDPTVKADTLAIQAAISLFVLFIFYSQAVVNLVGMEIIYSAVLGYLAYLYKEHCPRSSTAVSRS